MNRRDLLALGGVTALTGLSGCLGYDVVESETVADRRVRIAELEAQVAAREERIAELEAQTEAMETRLTSAEERVRGLEARLDGPRVNDVSLVSRWDRLGDVVHRATTRGAVDGLATIAVNFTTPAIGTDPERGEQEAAADRLSTVEVTLRDATGEEVETRTRELRYFVDTGRFGETQLLFDTRGLTPGTYTAVARVVDVVAGVTSAPLATGFTLE